MPDDTNENPGFITKEVPAEAISWAAESEGYHERAEDYGERAWRVKGQNLDVIYWDTGNGWSEIMEIIPKSEIRDYVQEFWNKVNAYDDEL